MKQKRNKFYYNLDWLPHPIWNVLFKLTSRPFQWAHARTKQTILTRFIRATWRAL